MNHCCYMGPASGTKAPSLGLSPVAGRGSRGNKWVVYRCTEYRVRGAWYLRSDSKWRLLTASMQTADWRTGRSGGRGARWPTRRYFKDTCSRWRAGVCPCSSLRFITVWRLGGQRQNRLTGQKLGARAKHQICCWLLCLESDPHRQRRQGSKLAWNGLAADTLRGPCVESPEW